jgi:tRNA A58 N-methylase Trm61
MTVGCGLSVCLRILSELLGLSGRVVGVERHGDKLEIARTLISEHGLTNVEVLEADARCTGLPSASLSLCIPLDIRSERSCWILRTT